MPTQSKPCRRCGTPFACRPSHFDKKSYCSKACMAEDYRTRFAGAANPHFGDKARRMCAHCGAAFDSYDPSRIYCSRACSNAAPDRRRRLSLTHWLRAPTRSYRQLTLRLRFARPPRPGRPARPQPLSTTRVCGACGTEFVSVRFRRYCHGCATVTVVCVVCGGSFSVHRSTEGMKVACSPECSRVHRGRRQQGEKSHRWQGGKTATTLLFRASKVYDDWRRGVFERDNYTCRLCGKRGPKLSAHHIKRFHTHPELALDPVNGIALCWPCHASIKGKEEEYEARFTRMVREIGDATA